MLILTYNKTSLDIKYHKPLLTESIKCIFGKDKEIHYIVSTIMISKEDLFEEREIHKCFKLYYNNMFILIIKFSIIPSSFSIF